MTPEQLQDARRRERDAAEYGRLANPLERIADALYGDDDGGYEPPAASLDRLADAAEAARDALEEIARALSPGWKTRVEKRVEHHQRMLEERRRCAEEAP